MTEEERARRIVKILTGADECSEDVLRVVSGEIRSDRFSERTKCRQVIRDFVVREKQLSWRKCCKDALDMLWFKVSEKLILGEGTGNGRQGVEKA